MHPYSSDVGEDSLSEAIMWSIVTLEVTYSHYLTQTFLFSRIITYFNIMIGSKTSSFQVFVEVLESLPALRVKEFKISSMSRFQVESSLKLLHLKSMSVAIHCMEWRAIRIRSWNVLETNSTHTWWCRWIHVRRKKYRVMLQGFKKSLPGHARLIKHNVFKRNTQHELLGFSAGDRKIATTFVFLLSSASSKDPTEMVLAQVLLLRIWMDMRKMRTFLGMHKTMFSSRNPSRTLMRRLRQWRFKAELRSLKWKK